MLAENSIFPIHVHEKQLISTQRHTNSLTPDAIDYEMNSYLSRRELQLHHLSQKGLEHFVSVYGATYKVLSLIDCCEILDFSPLADLHSL